MCQPDAHIQDSENRRRIRPERKMAEGSLMQSFEGKGCDKDARCLLRIRLGEGILCEVKWDYSKPLRRQSKSNL